MRSDELEPWMKWTFKREAEWMIWLMLIPALLILLTLIWAWLRRLA
jgi:hypothetical protein